MKCETVLVPMDFSSDADHALSYAIGLAQKFQANVLLLHVVYLYLPASAEASFPAYMAQLRTEAEQQLSVYRLTELCRRPKMSTSTSLSWEPTVARACRTCSSAASRSASCASHRAP